MTLLPRVTEKTRELVARELDTRGPDVCAKEIIEHLERDNPELLNMAAKCSADLVSRQGHGGVRHVLPSSRRATADAGHRANADPASACQCEDTCKAGGRNRSERRRGVHEGGDRGA